MASHLNDASEEADMDMTPMIDVVFLLIIFFLCIDFRTLEAKLPAYLPTDKGSNPDPAEPVEQLSVRIEVENEGQKIPRRPDDETSSYYVVGHKVRWEVNTRRFTELDKLREHLAEIAADPTRMVPDKDNPGQRKLMAVVIEPQPGTVYSDVASTVDAIRAAKFEEINFGGGRGPGK
jgi:biopolymer transport protein ExbD